MRIQTNPSARERGLVRRSRSQGGSAFILAMVALVVLLFLGVSFTAKTINALQAASNQRGYTSALMLAESGVDRAIIELYEDYNGVNATLAGAGQYSETVTLPQGSVTYNVTGNYHSYANTVLVESTGTTNQGKTSKVRVVAEYTPDVSRVFRGAIFSDNPLTLNGAGGVYPDSSGEGGDIYAHGSITFNGTSFTMTDTGYIYSTGTTNWVPSEVPQTHVYQNIAPFPMPVIDLQWYRDHATTTYIGNENFNGGTALDGITFVQGDVKMSGSFTGKGVIVATGSISVTGNVTAGDINNDALVLLSPQAVKIAGNSRVEGLVYSHNVNASVTLSGNPQIYGAIVADVVTTNGSIEVYYKDVWSGLQLPGTGKTQWAQVSWQQVR